MPAETHQRGRAACPDDVVEFLCFLLGDLDVEQADSTSLADADVDDLGIADLWHLVCEELAERSLGPELPLELVDPSVSIRRTAAVMAAVLEGAGGDGA